MDIYIPSRGRPHRQKTALALVDTNYEFKIVISTDDPCRKEYLSEWGRDRIVVVQANGIADKRQKILKMRGSSSKILMLDDDLTFYTRLRDGKFTKAYASDVYDMLYWFEEALDTHVHAGIVDKFMSQHAPRGVVEGKRYNQVLGYNKALFGSPHPTFRLPINEEHDMHLQLAARGHASYVSCEFSKDAAYYAKGGCSTWRTKEVEAAAHRDFAKLWPELVKVVPSKKSISGLAIRVNWRKAVQ